MLGILDLEVSKDHEVSLIITTRSLMIPLVSWTNLVTNILINYRNMLRELSLRPMQVIRSSNWIKRHSTPLRISWRSKLTALVKVVPAKKLINDNNWLQISKECWWLEDRELKDSFSREDRDSMRTPKMKLIHKEVGEIRKFQASQVKHLLH